jgi:hypothetical protein
MTRLLHLAGWQRAGKHGGDWSPTLLLGTSVASDRIGCRASIGACFSASSEDTRRARGPSLALIAHSMGGPPIAAVRRRSHGRRPASISQNRRYPAWAPFASTFALAAALQVLPVVVKPALANCVESSTDHYTCTGNLSTVRANAPNSYPPNSAQSITVEALTADIPNEIFYVAAGKNNQPVNLNLDTGAFKVTGGDSTVLIVETSSASGADRPSDTLGTITGGGSSPSGPATLALKGEVVGSSHAAGAAVRVQSASGRGGNGASMTAVNAGNGGSAGGAGTVTLLVLRPSSIIAPAGAGISMSSIGGNGGAGGTSGAFKGGNGHGGAAGGSVVLTRSDVFAITASGASNSPAIQMLSQGGQGGNGGSGNVFGAGGDGGVGGAGGAVIFESAINATTKGSSSDAIVVTSIGGVGGTGGDGGWFTGGAPGGGSGIAGDLIVSVYSGSITTSGVDSAGIAAQSIGGRAGAGGGGGVFSAANFGASGGSAGAGGTVVVENASDGPSPITTTANQSTGIVAQSIGGAGGHGGDAISEFYVSGGTGSYGGDGGSVTVDNGSGGTITTSGHDANGIVAQSIGGTGGSGGSTVSLDAFGGNAVAGGHGGTVAVNNAGTIRTGIGPSGDAASDAVCQQGCSLGILAQSIGGGGGNGGSSGGAFSIGGAAGGGGAGGTVTIANTGNITTDLIDSPALFVQSIGGGGGRGGGAIALSALASMAIGGTGGNGGSGGTLNVNPSTVRASAIKTSGDRSHGILAQSIGGGGGLGGFSASGAFGVDFPAVDLAIGGNGGAAGSGGAITLYTNGSVETEGADSAAVVAQSIGGGGGNGGFAVSITGSDEGAISVGIGGTGGSGNTGGNVALDNGAAITTSGDRSPGLIAQSVGGGGGNGALVVALALGLESPVALAAGVGGAGGAGGNAQLAKGSTTSSIQTTGDDSPGILAQSVGGGGGNGGLAVSGTLNVGSGAQLAAAVGGKAGASGNSTRGAGVITALAETTADITTSGERSTGIIVQSIGGGGGNGGSAIAANISTGESTALQASIGGKGAIGGSSSVVSLKIDGDVSTTGDQSGGVLAQSIGGGGGNGGTGISGALTLSESTTIGVALGGNGGSGGVAGPINLSLVNNVAVPSVTGNVTTSGLLSDGIVAQSIGGGGGNGGYAISGSISTEESTGINVSLGGGGASGSGASLVDLWVTGDVTASGQGSRGIVAQSIGGGGGNGGMAITGDIATSEDNVAIGVALGGGGGSGSAGSAVTVTSEGTIITGGGADDETRTNGHGIVAQSIGGGGGTGGLAANGTANTDNKGTQSIEVGIGGAGGTGATAGKVTVSNAGAITTANASSHGILAQSIAGGGGDGGSTTTFEATPSSSDEVNKAIGVNVGGRGGGGAASSEVAITLAGEINTTGLGSRGVLAQSVAGGGGTGGSNVFKTFNKGQVSDKTTNTVSVGIGGAGGTSSNGGAVSLLSSSSTSVTTGNNRSLTDANVPIARYAGHGIFLQSIGGGGGDGGAGIQGDVEPQGSSVGLDIGIGGKGTGGGNGGAVTVGDSGNAAGGTIVTSDPGAFGLFAQSVGGGGGSAGTGISGDVSNGNSKGLAFGLGNSGGGGGKGGDIAIRSAFSVDTSGDGSKGVFAQSVGGGGGAGGTGIAGDISGGDDKEDTKQISFGLGLSGGGGGDGGAVTVNTTLLSDNVSAAIRTGTGATGAGEVLAAGLTGAEAIFAQSVGGGGGAGGIGIVGKISNSSKANAMSLNLGIGTAGGAGGTGGAVTVNNDQILSATGNGARGIFAQSVGGGGGAGGMGLSGDIEAPSDAEADKQVDVGIGGAGGGGGAGGKVLVQNTGTISTSAGSDAAVQGQMHGIFAQSIGGGGGDGAIGINGGIKGAKTSKALNVAVGGSGGSGGDGAQGDVSSLATAGVGVSNLGAITTRGDGSVGIFAQNIGGGGGNGAVGLGGAVDSGDGKAISFSLGATGGNGGAGGSVFVDNRTGITTGVAAETSSLVISQAHGILAQSIGGGGGTGQLTGSLLYGSTSSGTEKGIAFTVGGTAGGGDGGAVAVSSIAPVITYNRVSHAIFAQSIGGGGGLAGDLGGIGTEDASNTWDAAIAIGGGGGAGNGAGVTVDATGNQYRSLGDGSSLIVAQSIGGGGGVGGDGAGLSDTGDDTQTTKNALLAINVGGQNGSTGDGGTVEITAGSGFFQTSGASAPAILAQSIGGGGGTGGAGATGLTGTLTVAGSGGSAGDGKVVTLDVEGDISTSGALGSAGIIAQSIGGGGGFAGTFQAQGAQMGSGLKIGVDTENSGNGGAVTVTVGGSVFTTGDDAVAVLAQSVGGGGGVAGYADGSPTGALIGSSGGHGNASAVHVTIEAGGVGIKTTGAGAHGIIAQSAGGAGSSTSGANKVVVTANSNVIAQGASAHGIIAQSSGNETGNVIVNVGAGAAVQGGSTSDSVAVFIRDGLANTLTNDGTIASSQGASGTAIRQSGNGFLHVVNNGTITGKIAGNTFDADEDGVSTSAPITLQNMAQGIVTTDGTLDVARFENAGTLDVAGNGTLGAVSLTGDLVQSNSGTIAVDLHPGAAGGRGAADRLSVGGRARLDGEIAVNLMDLWQPHEGGQSVPVLSAEGGLSLSGIEVTRSAVAQYRLHQPSAGSLHVGYNIDFANAGILAKINDNQDNIARYIHGIYRAQGLDSDIARALIAIEDTGDYTRVMNSLSAEIAVDTQITSLLSGIRFNDALLSCAERGGDYRFFDQGQCGWLRLGGQRFEQHETSDNLGFDEDSWQLAGGGQIDIGNGWHLGGALSYEGSNLNADDSDASSDGERFQAGVSAKRRFDATEVSGSLAVGYGHFDIDRNPWPGVNIEGTQTLWLYSGQLRAAHLLTYGHWTFKPRIDLGVDYLSMGGFSESGGSAFRIRHDGENTTYVNLQPAIDIATELETDNGVLIRPKLSLGITQFIGGSAPSVTGSFAPAPAEVAPFTTSTELDKTRFDVAASVDVFTRKDLIVRAEVFGSFADNTESYGGGLALAMPF